MTAAQSPTQWLHRNKRQEVLENECKLRERKKADFDEA